jgi:hypothetical protein
VSGLQFTTAAEIAAALEGRREGRQWRCLCPIHGGRSLLVRDGDAGRILVFCHGGCETRDVLAELRRSGLIAEAIRRGPAHAALFACLKDARRAETALIAVAGLMRIGGT